MAEGYNFLEGSQTDINRRLLRKIEALEAGESGETADITALKVAVGADDTTGLRKRCKDLEDAIGSEDTANSILARIKALEDAQ